MKALLILVLLSLGGCATLERHPVASSFAVAFIGGSIAASTHHDNRTPVADPVAHSGIPACFNGSCK
jgi:hypothetical protein